MDAVADAEKLARKAEKETVDATEALTDLKKELIQMEEKTDKSEVDEFTIFELKKAVKDAEKRVEIAARRSAKLKAKAENTAQSARKMGIQTEKPEQGINAPPNSK